MRKFFLAASLSAVAVLVYESRCNAQEICAQLLAQGIRDTASTAVSESRFNELKSNVCNSNYDSYGKAAQKAMSGGFDLPGVFGINFGESNATNEYGTKWSNFCKSDYSKAMSNSELRTNFSTANRAVLNSFDNCVNVSSERFIRYIETQVDGRTFAIVFNNRRQGNPSFEIIKISLTNSTTGQVMSVNTSCDFDHTLPWSTAPLNAVSLVCRKEPSHSVVVAGTTTAGNIDPVVVPARPDAPPQLSDRVAQLEGSALSLQTDLGSTIQKLNNFISQEDANRKAIIGRIDGLGRGGNAYSQPGTFNSGTQTCPAGQFVVAVKQQIDGGGPHGITSWLGVTCRNIDG